MLEEKYAEGKLFGGTDDEAEAKFESPCPWHQ